MKKNITIKSNINKVVKIHNLQQYTYSFIYYFLLIDITPEFHKIKKPTLKKEWENCYEKEKVTEFKNPVKQM